MSSYKFRTLESHSTPVIHPPQVTVLFLFFLNYINEKKTFFKYCIMYC